MPLYRYQALAKDGKKTVGVIHADSYEVARESLKKQKIYVTRLLHYSGKEATLHLPESLLIAFTRDLAQLLKAGLPLYESLLTIEEKYRKHKAHPLLLDLCDKVKHGKTLSSALSQYPKTFNQIYISMVASAEETGSLPEIFFQLEQLIAKQHKLKKQLVSAMIYPMFLLSFCLIVVIALFFFLIPSMQQLFEGRALHPMTQIVLSTSLFLREQGMILGVALLLLVGGAIFFFSKKEGKKFLQQGLLKVPILNRVVTQAVLVRFCRALSVMLKGSVPLIEALELSKKIMNHALFEEVLANARLQVVQGSKLSYELGKSSLIPPLVVRMLAIAEETGSSAQMLSNIADIYEEELDKGLARFSSMLQPVMLLFLAVIVGFVILSILLPLTDVGSFLNH